MFDLDWYYFVQKSCLCIYGLLFFFFLNCLYQSYISRFETSTGFTEWFGQYAPLLFFFLLSGRLYIKLERFYHLKYIRSSLVNHSGLGFFFFFSFVLINFYYNFRSAQSFYFFLKVYSSIFCEFVDLAKFINSLTSLSSILFSPFLGLQLNI